jgi:Tfp pilus assembly protein PilN
MSAHKTKDSEINLLPQKSFEASTPGRILTWILSTFRIIVIVTEIIVMLAFLSRFWFDAQNSDLDEKIQQKKAVLIASREFELEYKDIQKRLNLFTHLTEKTELNSSLIDRIKNFLPQDVILARLITQNDKIKVFASTPNEGSVKQYLVNLGSFDDLKNITLSSTSTSPENPSILEFTINAEITKNVSQ